MFISKAILFAGHAYSITKVVPKLKLIRLRNPWGEHEWTGPWSDNSPEWKKLSKKQKETLEYKKLDDGEFYMSIKDFVDFFDLLSICNLSHLEPELAWYEEKIFGRWTPNFCAGGISTWKSFATNPKVTNVF